MLRDAIGAGHGAGGDDRGDEGAVHADVVGEDVAEREEGAVPGEGDLDGVDLLALLGGGQEVLEAILDPLDGAAQAAGQPADERLLGIEARLGPEAAADVRGRDHAHAVLGQVEEIGEHGADGVRCLGGVPDGEGIQRLVVARDEAAALHRVAAAAHHAEGLAERVVGGGERPLGLADALDDVGRDVVAQLVIDQRGAGGEGGRRGGDDGQGLVVHLDEVARVLGERARLGHHGRDHLADVADLRDGQGVAHAVADGGARGRGSACGPATASGCRRCRRPSPRPARRAAPARRRCRCLARGRGRGGSAPWRRAPRPASRGRRRRCRAR